MLALIDPRPFQAALDQAQGQLKRDQAALANAKVDLERYKTLLAQQSISDQTYATQVSTVAQDRGTVAFDQAAVETAQLNLSYCRIVSPIAGRVGLRQVDIGNLLQANSSTIVIVTQMQPMSVLFTVPEDNVSSILDHLHRGDKLTVEAYDRSLTNKIATGTLSNSDNQIDTTTGTLKLRAMFDNTGLELFPNQFVNAHLILETLHDQIVVPAAALQNGSEGSYVYLVNADDTVHMQPVVTGPTAGDVVAVSKGLSSGQTVVTDGADQLRDGARVLVPGAPGAPGAAGGAAVRAAPGRMRSRRCACPARGRRHVRGQLRRWTPPARLEQQWRQQQWRQQHGAGGRWPALRTAAASHESVTTVHSAAGGHLAADGGDPARRRDRLPASCRSRRCRRWTTRPSRCRPSIPARAPRS